MKRLILFDIGDRFRYQNCVFEVKEFVYNNGLLSHLDCLLVRFFSNNKWVFPTNIVEKFSPELLVELKNDNVYNISGHNSIYCAQNAKVNPWA